MSRSTVLLVVLVVGGLGFGFFKVGIAPRLDERAKLDEQLATQQQAVADAQGQLVAARQAKQDFKRNSAAIVELGKAVPADADTGALVFQLQTEARRAGVSLRTFSAASDDGAGEPAVAAPAGLTAVPLELRFRGDFFALDQVLRRIRSFVRTDRGHVGIDGRLLVVRGIDIAPDTGGSAGEEGPANQLATTLKVVAFVRDPDAPAAAATAAPAGGAAPAATPAPAGSGPVSDQ